MCLSPISTDTHTDTIQHTLTPFNTHWHRLTHTDTVQHTLTPFNTHWHHSTHTDTIQHTVCRAASLYLYSGSWGGSRQMGLPWRGVRQGGHQGYAATASRWGPWVRGCSKIPEVAVPPRPALSSSPVPEGSRRAGSTQRGGGGAFSHQWTPQNSPVPRKLSWVWSARTECSPGPICQTSWRKAFPRRFREKYSMEFQPPAEQQRDVILPPFFIV